MYLLWTSIVSRKCFIDLLYASTGKKEFKKGRFSFNKTTSKKKLNKVKTGKNLSKTVNKC